MIVIVLAQPEEYLKNCFSEKSDFISNDSFISFHFLRQNTNSISAQLLMLLAPTILDIHQLLEPAELSFSFSSTQNMKVKDKRR